eukprot:TRINITY_DN6094_c0_g1_i2.p2 TRINITY_DN6094_c0_g1~~TRINITY_DN6094_c0_g1_i2.p2  ORF type:complete len:133 (+),score=46.54 TRINITY_DN6094_c0_g1_i2:67-465(+)
MSAPDAVPAPRPQLLVRHATFGTEEEAAHALGRLRERERAGAEVYEPRVLLDEFGAAAVGAVFGREWVSAAAEEAGVTPQGCWDVVRDLNPGDAADAVLSIPPRSLHNSADTSVWRLFFCEGQRLFYPPPHP